jgi:hypothetical protein
LNPCCNSKRNIGNRGGGVKWATFGDENTRFFHAHATIKHNKNSIMILKNDLGEEKSKHEDEAAIL